MRHWTAVVPLKLSDASKSRLGELLPIGRRLELVETMARHVLQVLAQADLVKGLTVGVDATTLEANAALRTIVRRDSGERYDAFLTRLAVGGWD